MRTRSLSHRIVASSKWLLQVLALPFLVGPLSAQNLESLPPAQSEKYRAAAPMAQSAVDSRNSEPRVEVRGARRLPVAPGAQDPALFGNVNEAVLAAVKAMPEGGNYAANAQAIAVLKSAVTVQDERLALQPALAAPSFCSGATYLVFLTVVERLCREGRLRLGGDALRELLVDNQPDGVGVWGRWNANGPGTARFFHVLGLGRNFTALEEARPGDFMKIFWNEHIGSKELGHSVVFLGIERSRDGQEQITFWSSNKPGGYGIKTVPRHKIKRTLFSRFEDPRGLARVPDLPRTDDYLAAMLKRPGTEEEMLEKVGIARAAAARPTPKAADNRRSRDERR